MRRRSGPRRSARDIDLAIALTPRTGHWLVKLDLVRGDRRLSRDGIVQPRLGSRARALGLGRDTVA